ncbi:MAG: DUF3303 family protein [Acidobacteriota bacterium]
MLHMVIIRHSAESCPGREGNEAIHPCLNTMNDLIGERGIAVIGKWADPPAHVNYLVMEAPNAHIIQEVLMESGVFAHTTSEVRPVLSMG